MQKSNKRPLQLTTETIRHLDTTLLEAVIGGTPLAIPSTQNAISCGKCV